MVFDLLAQYGASDEQLDFPVVYASAKEGWASSCYPETMPTDGDMSPLLDAVLGHLPPPGNPIDKPFQMAAVLSEVVPFVGKVGCSRSWRFLSGIDLPPFEKDLGAN